MGTGGVTVNDQAVFNVTNSSSDKVPLAVSPVFPSDHASVVTTGPQNYNDTADPVLLKADTVLKGTTLTLADGVDGKLATGTAYSLTLDFSGTSIVLPGNIVNLNNFASVGDGGTELAGPFTTQGFQYYKTAVTVDADSLLTSNGGQNITFDGQVNGKMNVPGTLSLTTQGDEVFNNLVGNLVPLTGLVVDNGVPNPQGTTRFYITLPDNSPAGTAGVRVGAGGVTINDAVVFGINGSTLAPGPLYSVLSVGPQTYAQAAALQATTVLTSTGGGDITFGSTVDGRADLTLDSAGNEIFNGRVGGQAGLALLSLTTDAETAYRGGSVIFNVASSATTPTVTTVNLTASNFPQDEATGAQTYHDGAQLEKDTFLSSTFNGAFGSTTGGAVTFYGPVTNFGATAESLTVSAGVGQTVFGTGAPVNAAQANIGGAQVAFFGPVGTAASPLNILTVGSNGTLAGTVPSIDINNGSITSTLGQTYTGQVYLSADTILTDTNLQNISFAGPVDSFDAQPRALTLSTGGTVTFNGLVGSAHPLAALTSSAAQGTFFNFDLTGLPAGVAGVNVSGDNVPGDNGVTINGPVTFNVLGSSLTDLTHPTVETGNGQLFNGPVTLAGNTSFYSSGGGNLAFTGTVDDVAGATPVGPFGLALNSTGNEIFGGIVGGQTALTSLTVDAQIAPGQGQTQFNMNVAGQAAGTAGVRVGAGGLTINDQTAFNVGGSLNNPSVLTFGGGTQTYQDAVLSTDTVLAADSLGARAPIGATFTGGGAILFHGNVSGTGATPSLTVRTGAGVTTFQHDVLVNTFNVTGANVTFDGRVIGLNLLSIAPNANVPGSTPASSIDLNGGTADSGDTVRTSGGQTYGSPVLLGADSLLADTGGSPITFNSTLDGNVGLFNLTIGTTGAVTFGQAVGGATPLQSLTINQASGIFINGGSVTTEASAPGAAGGQFYHGPVILGPGLTTLTDLTPAVGRQIVLGGTVNGNPAAAAGALNVNAYDITFGGAVGAQTALQSLTAGGADHTFINGGSVATTTFQTYGSVNGTVIGNPTVLTAGTDLTFNTVLTGAASPANSSLTLTAPGNILFAAAVGMTANGTAAPLTSLTVTGGTLNINGGLVATTGAQLFGGAALLGATTTLQSAANGNIVFSTTLDGGYGLAVNTGGTTAFDGKVGGTTALTKLTTDNEGQANETTQFNMDATAAGANPAGVNVAGQVEIGDAVIFNVAGSSTAHPSVQTLGGAQIYNGKATMTANTLLSATGNGNLTFASTLDGTFNLTLNTGGLTTFNGLVGGVAALASVTTDAGGTTQVNGGGVTTTTNGGAATGAQTYNDAVTLGADAVLTSQSAATGGAITFNSTVDGPFNLTVTTSGDTVFNRPVGGQGPGTALLSLLTNGSGRTLLNGGEVNTTGAQTYGDAVLLGADATLNSGGTTGSGSAITFQSTVDGTFALTVNTTGSTTFGGLVGNVSPLASLTTDAGGTTFINGGRSKPGTIVTNGFQSYGDAVELGKDALLVSNDSGAITFDSTVDGPFNLTVKTGGDTIFGGSVGNTGKPLASLITDAGGTTRFNAPAGQTLSVTTTGLQTYGDAVLLGANTLLTSKNSGGSGNITFAKTIDGPFALTVNTTGSTTFGGLVGNVSPLASLTTDAGGTTFINGGRSKPGTIVTNGFQSYGDAVELGKDALLVSNNGGDITFANTVDGGSGNAALTVKTGGDTIFDASVGSRSPLASLTTTDEGGTTRFDAATGGGLSVTTTDFQTYGDRVELGADATLISQGAGSAITFAQTVNGTHALTVNTSGATIFTGAVGSDADPLLSLTTDAGGTTQINGGGVTTTNSQTYGDALTLGAAGTTLFYSKLGGTIDFAGTVDATQKGQDTLQINTPGGASFLRGNVGTAVPLAALFDGPNTDNTAIKDPTQLPGLLTIGADQVLTSGEQRYEGAVATTATLATLTAGGAGSAIGSDLRFDAVINALQGLTLTGDRIAVQGNIIAGGNLDLESTAQSPLLLLGGTSYTSTAGRISFNAPVPDPARQSGYVQRPDYSPTILLTSDQTVKIQGTGFTMGYLQKILALGTLDINVGSGTATVGDIAARNSLMVTASQINLLARPPGDPSQDSRPGVSNNGLNFVADNSIDFGRARITFIGATNPTASFITRGANITIQRIQGISLFRDPNVDSQFRDVLMPIANDDLDALNNAADRTTILEQPVGGGSQALDTAAALSGALPDQKPIDVATDITISPSQMEELKKLGIHPRVAQRSERASIHSKRALFAQLVDGEDKDNYGLLQPIKGGVSRLEPSDYVVVVDRMGEREVQSILKSFEDLYGKNKEKVPDIGGAFSKAFSDYTVQKQTSDPAGFGPFLQSQPGKYPAIDTATRGFDDLFGHIEHLGLTDKEVEKSEQHIVSDLGVAGVTDAEMVTVIKSLRKKLPPEQRAASTKAPPSAPVANPAPGATAPAPGAAAPTPAPAPAPEKKTKQPTTVQQDEASPRKTARRQRAARADRRPELAGL